MCQLLKDVDEFDPLRSLKFRCTMFLYAVVQHEKYFQSLATFLNGVNTVIFWQWQMKQLASKNTTKFCFLTFKKTQGVWNLNCNLNRTLNRNLIYIVVSNLDWTLKYLICIISQELWLVLNWLITRHSCMHYSDLSVGIKSWHFSFGFQAGSAFSF